MDWTATEISSWLLPPHPFRFYIHGLCLEWLRKNSENISTAGVPGRFKPGTLQIQVTSVTTKANLLFVSVGRLNASCVRCHQTVCFFWWLCATYRMSINFRWNKEQISLPLYTTYGESSLPRCVLHLMLFTVFLVNPESDGCHKFLEASSITHLC